MPARSSKRAPELAELILANQAVQIGAAEPALARRARDVAAVLVEELAHVAALPGLDELRLGLVIGVRRRGRRRRGAARGDGQAEALRLERAAVALERDAAAQHVLELAHVARPVVLLEQRHRRRRDLHARA